MSDLSLQWPSERPQLNVDDTMRKTIKAQPRDAEETDIDFPLIVTWV